MEEINETVENAKKFAVNETAKKYGKIFEQQARRSLYVAIVSLAVLILSIVGVIATLYRFFLPFLDKISEQSTINPYYVFTNLTFRFSIIAIGLLIIKEALKNYNVNMHLHYLNKHRQNALDSFDALVNPSQDPSVTNYLIKEIARTIYSHGKIGYLQGDLKYPSPKEITDLFKSIKG